MHMGRVVAASVTFGLGGAVGVALIPAGVVAVRAG
jgi:hypothetical protein